MKIISRLFTIFALFIFFTPKIFAQDITSPWFATTALPYSLASHVAFGYNWKLFVHNGSASTGNSHNQIISSTLNSNGTMSSWSTNAFSPTALIWHSLIRKDNNIYILGGKEENPGSSLNYVNKVFRGDVNNLNVWNPTTPLPNNLSNAGAVVVGNWIYFMGGRNNSGTSQGIYYAPINPDGTLGAWITSSTTLPTAKHSFGVVSYNNHIIIVGGVTGSVTNKVYKTTVNPADGSISPWTEIASLPGSQNGQNHTVLVGKTLMTVGGGNNSGPTDKIYYTKVNADGTVQPWAESTHHLPQPLGGSAVAYANGYLYITGGFNAGYKNVVYASKLNVESNLSVPLLKQTDPAWGAQVYDSADVWSPSSPGISSWGCAMTSAAMVFQFHGIEKLPNGLPLNPGTLNSWLKQQPDGYVGTGWVNWIALSRLSKQAKSQNPSFSFDALEYDRKSGHASSQLNTDIENNIPGILEVTGGPGGQHFVVGKGVKEDKVFINDPYYSREDLSEYGNSFKSLGRYIPSNTDLSYILLTAPKEVTLSVKDENGDTVGEGFLQEALDNDEGENKNTSLYMYYIPKPTNGNYLISVNSDITKQYDIKQYVYDADGEVKIIEAKGIVGNGITDIFNTSYNKDNISQSSSSQEITFASLISDVDLLYKQGKIKNLGIYIALKTNSQMAEKFSKMGINMASKAHVKTVIAILDAQRKKHITEDAFQILMPQAQFLLLAL